MLYATNEEPVYQFIECKIALWLQQPIINHNDSPTDTRPQTKDCRSWRLTRNIWLWQRSMRSVNQRNNTSLLPQPPHYCSIMFQLHSSFNWSTSLKLILALDRKAEMYRFSCHNFSLYATDMTSITSYIRHVTLVIYWLHATGQSDRQIDTTLTAKGVASKCLGHFV